MGIFNTENILPALKNELAPLLQEVKEMKEVVERLQATTTAPAPEPETTERETQEEPVASQVPNEEPAEAMAETTAAPTEAVGAGAVEVVEVAEAAETAAPAPVAQESQVEELLKDVKGSIEQLRAAIDTSLYQEKLIRELHTELQEYKKGFLDDLRSSYITDIINIYDRIADTLAHFDPSKPDFDPAKQKRMMENNMYAVLDLLEDQYSIDAFEPVPGDSYVPKEHKAMRSIETTDDAKAGTVAETLTKGFRNSQTGRIVRAARVNVYRKVDNKD